MGLNLLFVGIQGSGKGTMAKIMSAKFGLCHISTGDLLRNASGELKKEIDEHMNSGKLVPDELMLKVLKEKLDKPECSVGVILDGFPRNLKQAEELDKIMKVDNVINIELSDETAIKRMNGRWNCRKCGIPYNVVTEPKPKVEGVCDVCGLELYQRADDIDDEAINKRLETYKQETMPILKHYNSIKINGEQSIEKEAEDIEKAIKMLKMLR